MFELICTVLVSLPIIVIRDSCCFGTATTENKTPEVATALSKTTTCSVLYI